MNLPADRDPRDGLTRRVSDAERARAANVVDAAVADGRLTWTEHSERSGQIWAAQTRGDLLPPLADLGPVALELPQTQQVSVAFSKVVRAVAADTRRVEAKAVFGAIVLDLTALAPGQEIDVNASSFCGKVVVLVPEDATVVDRGTVLLGKRATMRTSVARGGPVIRLDGRSSFGNLKVFRPGEGAWGEQWQQWLPQVHVHGDQHVHIHRDRHVHFHGRQTNPHRRRRSNTYWGGGDYWSDYS